MDRYQVQKKIGQGSFGLVHLARSKAANPVDYVVIKEIKLSKLSRRERHDVQVEVQILAQLHHPNVVAYVESFEVESIGWLRFPFFGTYSMKDFNPSLK